jgi:ADP-heptose:LPS heptosyltransferase
MPPDAPRILVIRRRYLGDIVLLGGVFRSLRAHWPNARIAAAVEPPYAAVLGLNPDVDAALPLPSGLGETWRFLRRLSAERFTHVLDFDNTDRTAALARLSGARVRVAYDRELIPFRHRWVYTHAARVENRTYDSQPITATYQALPAALGIPAAPGGVRLVPRPDDLAEMGRLVGGNRRRLLVHPGTRSPYRRWPAERFAAVCDAIQDALDAQVFVVAGPGEVDFAREIRDRAQAHVVLVDQRLSIPRFAALAASFPAMLCHDSGPMHIAAAVGTRVVALFSSQNARIWGPVGEGHRILQTELPCPCLPEGSRPGPCVRSDSYRSWCVRRIEVDTVVSELSALLG